MSFTQCLQENQEKTLLNVAFNDVECKTINGNVPPIVTSAPVNEIPVFTGSLNPVFKDSNMAIVPTSSFVPSALGQGIDLDRSTPLTDGLVLVKHPPMSLLPKIISLICNAPQTVGQSGTILIENRSPDNGNFNIVLRNQAPTGSVQTFSNLDIDLKANNDINIVANNGVVTITGTSLNLNINGNSFVWPTTQGVAGSSLLNDGSGNLYWSTPA